MIDDSQFVLPVIHDRVNKEECVLSFQREEDEDGVYVCLRTHQAYSLRFARKHAALTGQYFYLHLKRIEKKSDEDVQEDGGVRMTEDGSGVILGGGPEFEEIHQLVYIGAEEGEGPAPVDPTLIDMCPEVELVVRGILEAPTGAARDHAFEYRQQLDPCPPFEQLPNPPRIPSSDHLCCQYPGCTIRENLWLNLTDGFIACGREQYGGQKGCSHALRHFEETGYRIAVKLGTITPQGSADVHCYEPDMEVFDADLAAHLSHFGIEIAKQEKTEKSLFQMELDTTMMQEWKSVMEDGKEHSPVFGPGLTGIRNIGNSCYIASVLQVLFSQRAFQQRYFGHSLEPRCALEFENPSIEPDVTNRGSKSPADLLECQLRKMAAGLLSGHYSRAPDDKRPCITPRMLKRLVGANHPDFSTSQQQDAEEYLTFLLDKIRAEDKNQEKNVAQIFDFEMEKRIQCTACRGVMYSYEPSSILKLPIPSDCISYQLPSGLKKPEVETDQASQPSDSSKGESEEHQPLHCSFSKCIDSFFAKETIEFTCPACQNKTAELSLRFKSFPQVLAVQLQRYTFVDWNAVKIDTVIDFDGYSFDFENLRGHGPQPQEELLPNEGSSEKDFESLLNPDVVNALLQMGFSENQAKRAVLENPGKSADDTMMWLFEHMSDPEMEEDWRTLAAQKNITSHRSEEVSVPIELIETVCMLGFSPKQSSYALRKNNMDPEAAVNFLFSNPEITGEEDESDNQGLSEPVPDFDLNPDGVGKFKLGSMVTHLGRNTGCGHYVAHIQSKENNWIFFNDENVSKMEDPPAGLAYMYFLNRM